MIDRRSRLSGDEFRERYVRTRTPVLITNMMSDWPASYLWTKTYLAALLGHQVVEVMTQRDTNPLFEQQMDNHRSSMLFSEFCELAFSHNESNNTYMVANNQFMNTAGGQRLMQDVVIEPQYFTPQWQGRVFFWFGPGGTITPLHYDVLDITLTQIRGRKSVRLFSPDQTHLLYNTTGVYSDVNVEHPDFARHPLYRHARPDEFELNAGEMLYLPEGHWHQVHSLEPSISVSFTNFVE